jgi:Na+/H+ antiporter NhaD/arsenite permease-like protein
MLLLLQPLICGTHALLYGCMYLLVRPAGGVMFFLGILLSVEALNAAGLLQQLAAELSRAVPDVNLVAAAIGLASAVIDNVSCC